MPDKPRISVIIPAYNCARFLPHAIASARAQQGYDLELLVIDDGSTDGTRAAALAEPDVRYFYQTNAGPSAARNRGLAEATGEFIAFLDADDLWPADHLDLLLPPLLEDEQLAFSWGDVSVVQLGVLPEQGSELGAAATFTILEVQTQLFLVGATLCRRWAFERIGGFDPEMRLAEDLDWIARARHVGAPYVRVPHVVLTYRKHPASLTAGKSFHELNLIGLLRRSIQRRRQPTAV